MYLQIIERKKESFAFNKIENWNPNIVDGLQSISEISEYPVSGSSLGEKALFMLERRGKWKDSLKSDRKATITEITPAEEHL